MPNSDLINHMKRTIPGFGFIRRGIFQILAWPILCLILTAGLWYWTNSKINVEKQAYEKKALEEASVLCKNYAQYLVQAVEQANQITLKLQNGWKQSQGKLNLQELSQGVIFRNDQIANVTILNREGVPISSVPAIPQNVSFAERDYFAYHKNDDSDALLVGKPVASLLSGKPVITFSRRLSAPKGEFNGVALVAFDPNYLTAFYAGSFPGKTGLMLAAGQDGSLRSATIGGVTKDPTSAAQTAVPLFNSPEGASYMGGENQFADGRSRYVAWKTLEEYPLVAMVGLSQEEYLASHQEAWAAKRTMAISGSIILLLFALASVWMSTRLVRKKNQDEDVRKAYRIATESGSEGYYMYEALRDKSGNIVDFLLVDCNERGAEFYGIAQKQLLKMKLSALYTGTYFDELLNIFQAAMATGFYEDEIQTTHESKLQIEWAKRRLVRFGNGLAVTVQDISERKRAEEELRNLNAELEDRITQAVSEVRLGDWFKSGQNELNAVMRGEKNSEELADGILAFLIGYLGAGVGAFYLYDEHNESLSLISTYAAAAEKRRNTRLALGEGLTGQAALERKTIHFTAVPRNYLIIGSALGEADSRSIVELPLVKDNILVGVMELGSLKMFSDNDLEFLNQCMEAIAIAFSVNRSRQLINELLEQAQTQSEELRVKQEELQQANEELEERARMLEFRELKKPASV